MGCGKSLSDSSGVVTKAAQFLKGNSGLFLPARLPHKNAVQTQIPYVVGVGTVDIKLLRVRETLIRWHPPHRDTMFRPLRCCLNGIVLVARGALDRGVHQRSPPSPDIPRMPLSRDIKPVS